MNFSKNTWYIIGAVLLVIIIVMVITNQARAQKQREWVTNAKPGGSTTSTTGSSTGTGTSYTDSFPLKMGSRGDSVKAAQTLANEVCSEFHPFGTSTGWLAELQGNPSQDLFAPLKVDGVWGPKTAAAIDKCAAALDLKWHTPGQLTYKEFKTMKARWEEEISASLSNAISGVFS